MGFRLARSRLAESIELTPAFHLRRVTRLDERTVEAVTHDRDDSGVLQKLRWRLARSDDGWRVEDLENLDLGLSLSILCGAALGAAHASGVSPLMRFARGVTEAATKAEEEDWEGMREAMLDAPETLPRPLDLLRRTILLSAEAGLGEMERAVAEVRRLRADGHDAPLLAFVAMHAALGAGRHEEALAEAAGYEGALGPDPDARVAAARALRALGRAEEAVAAARAALALESQMHEAVGLLAAWLPADPEGEAARAFRGLRDATEVFAEIAETALEEEGNEGLEVLLGELRRLDPEHGDAHFYRGVLLEGREQWEKAAEAYHAAWRVAERYGWDPAFVAEKVVLARVAGGRPVEAWREAPDPDAAFPVVADALAGEEDAGGLARLLAAASEAPERPETWEDWSAHLDFLRKDHAAVRARVEPLLASRAVAWEEDEAFDRLWHLEDLLVRSLVRMGKAEAAEARARRIHQRDDDALYLLLVVVSLGRADDALHLARLAREEGNPDRFLDDADLGPLLATEPLRRVREALTPAEDDR
jgi:tetratricopeptide (TPR) repeat protein